MAGGQPATEEVGTQKRKRLTPSEEQARRHQQRQRSAGGGSDSLDPMDPAAYSEISRYVIVF